MTDEKAIALFTRGTDLTRLKVSVLMRSKDFIIFHVPGHKYQSGRESRYGDVEWILVRKGDWIFPRGNGKRRVWEGGRLNKKRLAEMKRALDASQDAGEVVL